jgi:short-subunit dehydrogenase
MTLNQRLSPELPLRTRPRAIVVGASSGIGAAIARRLAKEGYVVALMARRSAHLDTLCAEINQQHEDTAALAYPHDVTHFDEIPALFERVINDLGHLSIIVYNAGVMPSLGPEEYNFKKDKAVIDVNLLGAMAWLNPAATLFAELGCGQIVGISSIAGERGRVGHPPYHTSKAGFSTYLESLRNRLSRHGVHVLTVKPGVIDTDMLKDVKKPIWVISPDQAAADIWRAVQRRRQVVFTPARWRWVGMVIQHIPSFIFRRLSI